MNNKINYDYSISFIRVISMFFIVICHLSSHYGITVLAQFFNVGVPIFFMISGYLYGNKRIETPVNWLYKRYIRLVIPATMWLFLYSIINLRISTQQDTLMIFLNLHGIIFIFTRINDLGNGPWFLSVIMCCYIVLLCYLKVEDKHKRIEHAFDYGGVLPLGIFIVLALIGVRTEGILSFFIGFNLKRKGLPKTNKIINFIIALTAFVFAVAIRLTSKRLFDETVIHNYIIAPLSHVILASSIFIGVKWLFEVMPRFMDSVAKNRVFMHLDKISIYVYVSHDLLFFVLDLNFPSCVLLPFYFVIALLSATLIWIVGEFLTNKIDAFVQYCFEVI